MTDTATDADRHANVDDLKVGMFVHLDLGWMSHPFPLSSFRIASPDQIEVIRGLGVKRLRWSPSRSDVEAGGTVPMDGHGAGLVTLTGAPGPAPTAGLEDRGGSRAADAGSVSDPQARRAHAQAVTREHDNQRHCERSFLDATQVCRKALDQSGAQPHVARETAERLTRDLISGILVDSELSIRLLHESAGDKASTHALNVSVISLLLGRVFGLGEEEMLDLGVGALLHDIGKLGLPERVRHRGEHFTLAESKYYQEHVALGVAGGRRMGLRPGALLIVGQHHEMADGSGFPLGLNGDRIGFCSRIVALVNRYDNLCNPQASGRSMTPHEALSTLFAQGRSQFDTALMSGFIKMMGVYPPGSAVQLTDDRYGLVTTVNSTRPLKPRVLVHDPKVPRDEALPLDLERNPGIGIRRSLKPGQLPQDVLAYLSPRQRVTYYFEPVTLPQPLDHEAKA